MLTKSQQQFRNWYEKHDIANYQKNREHRLEITRKWRKTPAGKKYLLRQSYNEKIKYPVEYTARRIARYAVRMGRLKRLPCEVCGEIKVEGHHPDYSKPLEVKWLCGVHHREEHKRLLKVN